MKDPSEGLGARKLSMLADTLFRWGSQGRWDVDISKSKAAKF